ncbi:MAG: hypothetical protein WA867_15715, partial [Candidatus Acidiferrales bacterium]
MNSSTHEEMALLSACANTSAASARRGSASLTRPSAEQEFFRARHGDVQQSTFFAKIGVGSWNDAI